MPLLKSRIPFTPQNPYRTRRPQTSKIIFLSCEGSVTEEEYFTRISEIYSMIRSKIQLISVAEDAVLTRPKFRTPEQNRILGKTRPKQLVERIDQFKAEKEDIYQFSQFPEDEFWIVTDVDQNWSNQIIDLQHGKSYRDEWNEAIAACQEKGYKYAVSNPFFEIWLLLHHDEASSEDKGYAVTDTHPYEKTEHFQERLRILGVPMQEKKHINDMDYTDEKVKTAVHRADMLHIDKADLAPKYFSTTVYLLLQEIISMLPEDVSLTSENEQVPSVVADS